MRWFLFLSAFLILFLINSGETGPYKESAHGNATYGVKRSATGDYAQGNCVHCHEMHASIGGSEPEPSGSIGAFTLFSTNFNTSKQTGPYLDKSDDFCFYCHSSGGITNYDYSYTFGGASSSTTNNIMDMFNQASYHNLYDIWDFSKKTFTSFFTASSNPCVACHNPHIAKRSSTISKPTDHGNLWGDDNTERMDDYTTDYQPPYYYSSTNLEPDGASSDRVTQVAKTPDYVTFCTDCHDDTNQIPSQILGNVQIPQRNLGTGYLRTIDWNNEKHGKGYADNNTSLNPPYDSASNYVTSCTDCHEPHGSPNAVLIRSEVNGDLLDGNIPLDGAISTTSSYCPENPSEAGDKTLGYLCRRCHKDDNAFDTGSINSWQIVHHNNTSIDPPYPNPGSCTDCHHGDGNPITCTCCHYHGAQNVYNFTGRTF